VDPQRWPVTAGFVDRALAENCLSRLQPFEALMLRTPIRDHRDALRAARAPLTASTLGTGTPCRGVMRT
jgi:hypothetical protein